MPKPRYKTNSWKQYNNALINRGFLTFWIDKETIAEWKQNKQGKRGRPRRFSELAITTALMVKQLLGGKLSLKNYNAQVDETYAMIKTLNKITGLGMPETQYIV